MLGRILPAFCSWTSRIPRGTANEMSCMDAAKKHGGFTLIEAILSMTILTIMAAAITGLYASGLQTVHAQRDHMLIDSALRSQMELVLSTPFTDIASGTGSVTIDGQSYTVTTTAAFTDVDGVPGPEDRAMAITVDIDGRSLTTIVVDHESKLGKL